MSTITDVTGNPASTSAPKHSKGQPWDMSVLRKQVDTQVLDHLREGCRVVDCQVCRPFRLSVQAGRRLLREVDSSLTGDPDDGPGRWVRITTRDLSQGDPASDHRHPIIRAMNRATRRKWELTERGARLIDVLPEHEVILPVPAVVLDKVTDLDSGKAIPPFAFWWPLDLSGLPEEAWI